MKEKKEFLVVWSFTFDQCSVCFFLNKMNSSKTASNKVKSKIYGFLKTKPVKQYSCKMDIKKKTAPHNFKNENVILFSIFLTENEKRNMEIQIQFRTQFYINIVKKINMTAVSTHQSKCKQIG